MAYLKPERYFSRISRIDIQHDLLDRGYRFALLDIDNTILSRATHDVPRDVGVWLARAKQAGVTFCLVSNNWHAHVHDLARELSVPIVAKSCKPFPAAFSSPCANWAPCAQKPWSSAISFPPTCSARITPALRPISLRP